MHGWCGTCARGPGSRPDLRTAFSPNLLFWPIRTIRGSCPARLPGIRPRRTRDDGRARMIAGTFGVLAAAVVSLTLARLHGARWGLLGGLAILTVPTFPIFVSNQQADVPLSVYLGCAAALIALACARRIAFADAAAGGFAAGLGAWTKTRDAVRGLPRGWFSGADARPSRSPRLRRRRSPRGALLLVFKMAYAPANDLAHFSSGAGLLAHAFDPLRWVELLFRRSAAWSSSRPLRSGWSRGAGPQRLGEAAPGTPVGTALFLARLRICRSTFCSRTRCSGSSGRRWTGSSSSSGPPRCSLPSRRSPMPSPALTGSPRFSPVRTRLRSRCSRCRCSTGCSCGRSASRSEWGCLPPPAPLHLQLLQLNEVVFTSAVTVSDLMPLPPRWRRTSSSPRCLAFMLGVQLVLAGWRRIRRCWR